MNRSYPNHIFLVDSNKQFSNADGTNYSAQINQVTSIINGKITQRGTISEKLSAEKGVLSGLKGFYDYDTRYYNEYADANNWTAAYFHSNRRDNETVPKIKASEELIKGYEQDILTLNNEISELNIQRKSLVDAQIAENKERLANANLTPAQRLALEKQQAELKRAAQESESLSKNKKIIIIASSIVGVILVIGIVIYIIKKRKAGKASAA